MAQKGSRRRSPVAPKVDVICTPVYFSERARLPQSSSGLSVTAAAVREREGSLQSTKTHRNYASLSPSAVGGMGGMNGVTLLLWPLLCCLKVWTAVVLVGGGSVGCGGGHSVALLYPESTWGPAE